MGRTYALEIAIGDGAVQRLTASRSLLVLARPAGSGPPNLVWLALTPNERRTVVWHEPCGVYAAAPPQAGTAIAVHSAVYPALDGAVYPFDGTSFGAPAGGTCIPPRHYDVRNDAPYPVAFGLLQSAAVDGRMRRAPLNAIVLAGGLRASFTAAAGIYVWLQPAVRAGSVTPPVPPGVRPLVFDRDCEPLRCRYDERSGLIVPS